MHKMMAGLRVEESAWSWFLVIHKSYLVDASVSADILRLRVLKRFGALGGCWI